MLPCRCVRVALSSVDRLCDGLRSFRSTCFFWLSIGDLLPSCALCWEINGNCRASRSIALWLISFWSCDDNVDFIAIRCDFANENCGRNLALLLLIICIALWYTVRPANELKSIDEGGLRLCTCWTVMLNVISLGLIRIHLRRAWWKVRTSA